jgi:hypothetical protein
MNFIDLRIVRITEDSMNQSIEDMESRGCIIHNPLICFTGEKINRLIVSKVNCDEILLYRKGINYLYFTCILFCLFLKVILLVWISYFCITRVCEGEMECYVFLSPIATIFVIMLGCISIPRLLLTNEHAYHIENKCAFYIGKRKEKNLSIKMERDVKTKSYSTNKAYPVSLLHCKISDSCMIKLAFFHLPKETDIHQAIGCDVNDCLCPISLASNYHHVGVMVIFYYDVSKVDGMDEAIEAFRVFLMKSGFSVVLHKRDFVLVAVKRQKPVYEAWLIQEDDEENGVNIQIPFSD